MRDKSSVLITDGGGRGSALVDAYAKSPHVQRIFVVPGNDFMKLQTTKEVITFPDLKTTDVEEIVAICKKEKIDLIDVAQDNAVEAGVSDALRKHGFKVVGPSRSAGQIEWDKTFSRELLKKTSSPQPIFHIFHNYAGGIDFIKKQKESAWFVKASGLLEGKGALPAQNNKEAIKRIHELKKFGEAGKHFLIEQWLIGEEFSAFALTDGKTIQYIGNAQDHKRVFDGDKGENTGGMGCSTPPLVVTDLIQSQIQTIFEETLEQLTLLGHPYQGILYLGGIIVKENNSDTVYVIEFNARWGDPEAQVLLPGVTGDWFEIACATAEEKLDTIKVQRDNKARVAVAGVSKGYPGDYSGVKGKEILGLDTAMKMPHVRIYGAGMKIKNKRFYASGGRLFYLVGEGDSVIQAQEHAYDAMKQISIEGDNLHYRTDIGWRDVKRLEKDIIY